VQYHIPDVKEVRGIGLSLSKLEHADLGRGGIFSYLDSFYFLIFLIPKSDFSSGCDEQASLFL